MADDDKSPAELALEKAILDYMVENSESDGDSLILEGYLFQAFGRSVQNFDDHETSHIWGHMQGQPVHVTLGLADMLHMTIQDWFRSGEPRASDY